MASIAELVSEFAHTLGEPNNKGLREHIKLLVGQVRNEVIRRSYENHGYVDKVLTQRYRVSLTTINDGEIELPEGYFDSDIPKIKRTLQKVPRLSGIRKERDVPRLFPPHVLSHRNQFQGPGIGLQG